MAFLPNFLKLANLAGALLVALTLACGGGGGGRAPEGSLKVVNAGDRTMTELFVTPSSSTTWGVNQIAGGPLAPLGDFVILTPMDPGYYDVQAWFTDQSSDQAFDVLIQDGATTRVDLANSGVGSVDVINNAAFTIIAVYLTPSGVATWGPDQAGGNLVPGETLNLSGIPPGTYDLRVIDSDLAPHYVYGIPVLAGPATPVPVL